MEKTDNKNNISKNKVMIIAIAVILLTVVAVILGLANRGKEEVNDLKVKYAGGEDIKFTKFKNDFTKTKTITITNTSKESKTYSLEWVDVSNSLKKQNKFIYEIKGEGDRVAELGKSQVPVADAVIFTQVLIEAGKTQTYTVTFTYTGNEDAKFEGKIKVKSKKIDEKKLKKAEKKRNKEIEERIKKQKATKKQ